MAKRDGRKAASGDNDEREVEVTETDEARPRVKRNIPKLSRAIKALAGLRSELGNMRLEMAKLKDKVVDLMHEEKIEQYDAGGLLVTLKAGKEKIVIEELDADTASSEAAD